MKKKRFFRNVGVCLFIIISALMSFTFVGLIYRAKFKDVTMELGNTEIDLNAFVVSKMYKKRSVCLTDLDTIDLTTVGDKEIEFAFGDRKETVYLHIVDTTAPEVTFKDIIKSSDYEVNPEDFVESVEDLSEVEISTDTNYVNNGFGDYKINVIVTDASGNKTSEECTLTVSWIYDAIQHELGEELTKEEILLNAEIDGDKITSADLKSINVKEEGTYTLTKEYEGTEYTCEITVKDTKGPELVVKDISLVEGAKAKKNEDFVKKVSDASGEVTLEYIGELDYTKKGKQELTIIATDKYGNKTEKVATLTISSDTKGPVFSGLTSLSVEKNAEVDYTKGVKAVDAVDGTCEFKVDTSKVDLSKAGTYYAIYTSEDTSGNVTTKSRKITVKHDQADVDALFKEYYNKYLAGKSVQEMTSYVRKHVYYNHSFGDGDPIYYALTSKAGNCYVHALFLKRVFDEAGVKNMIIHTIDESHYWNLVYENGVWRHYDSTPGSHDLGPDTDDEKYNSKGLYKRDWDRSAYPKAE